MNMIKMDGQKPLRLGNKISLLQGGLRGNEKTVVGIDPGGSFGLTIINRELVSIYYGKLPTDKRTGWKGILAYDYITKVSILKDWKQVEGVPASVAIIEGAAYNERYGQVTLEERRFAMFLALHNLGFDVRIMPPATIRKKALGNGRATVGEIYPNMPHDAADSLGCAMAALKEMNES